MAQETSTTMNDILRRYEGSRRKLIRERRMIVDRLLQIDRLLHRIQAQRDANAACRPSVNVVCNRETNSTAVCKFIAQEE